MRGSSLGSCESSWAGDTRCTMYPIASTTAIRSWRDRGHLQFLKSVLVDSFGLPHNKLYMYTYVHVSHKTLFLHCMTYNYTVSLTRCMGIIYM